MGNVTRFGSGSRDFGAVRGLRLTADGDVDVVELLRSADGSTLAAMREALDARMVDCVTLAEGLDMWIDDEGAFAEPTPNTLACVASWPFLMAAGVPEAQLQPYFGTVVLLGVNTEDGETHTMPAAMAYALHDVGFPGVTVTTLTDLYEVIDAM